MMAHDIAVCIHLYEWQSRTISYAFDVHVTLPIPNAGESDAWGWIWTHTGGGRVTHRVPSNNYNNIPDTPNLPIYKFKTLNWYFSDSLALSDATDWNYDKKRKDFIGLLLYAVIG